MGQFNAVQWVIGEVNLEEVDLVRQQGQVFNYRDWSLQFQF